MQPVGAIQTLEVHLRGFPYRVAVFPNTLPDLGEVLEVHAFDVPDAEILGVSHQLNHLLVSLRLEPMAIGLAFMESESASAAARVPANAAWILPTRAIDRAARS